MQADGTAPIAERWTRQSISVMVVCFLAWAFDIYEATILPLATPAIMAELNASRTDIGILNVIMRWILAISSFIVIPPADVIGRRQILALVVLGYSLLTGLTGLSQNFIQLALLSCLTRVPLSAATLAGTMALEVAPTKARATAQGILGAGFTFGFLLCSALSIYLIPAFGWRSLYFVGVLPALLAFFILRHLPESPHYERVQAERQVRGRRTSLGRTYLTVLQRYPLETALGLLAFVCMSWPFIGFLAWIPTYLNVELEQGQALSSTYLTVWLVGGTIGYVGFGFAADRWGRRRTMPIVSVLAGAMFTMLGLVQDSMVLLVYGFFLTMFLMAPFGAGLYYLQEIFPTEVRATGWAIIFSAGSILAGFAPLVAGVTPSIAAAFPAYGLPFLVVALMFQFVFKETIGKELEDAVGDATSGADVAT
ncbi:MAG TPA: MFS transporter [Chloroflexota bacterium]|nr:MFS transporter [Chloroflexota bacterium]